VDATSHSVATYSRFIRGMTPIRPSRPIYGYKVRCSCGDVWQVNGGKADAVASFKLHRVPKDSPDSET
jgi:hypothetical protein